MMNVNDTQGDTQDDTQDDTPKNQMYHILEAVIAVTGRLKNKTYEVPNEKEDMGYIRTDL